jgi:hypothetical protein
VTGGEITSNATGGHNGAIHGEIGAGAAYIRGGKIITTGDDGAAIHSNGDIIITGGLVRSTGNGSVTIHHGGAGFVAYLKGTVSGDIDSDGAVIEIDTLNITEDDIGTSNGITVRSGALLKENITWGPHSDDGDPVLIFPGGIEIQWYGSGPIDEGNGGSNMLLYVGIIVVIAIAAFAAYWFFLRPK